MHLNFSETSESHYFFSQPHQPFFLLAFVNAIATMLIFMLSCNLFDISATVWMVMFIIWGIRFFAVLIYGKKRNA